VNVGILNLQEFEFIRTTLCTRFHCVFSNVDILLLCINTYSLKDKNAGQK
jgi:hypothetical protein